MPSVRPAHMLQSLEFQDVEPVQLPMSIRVRPPILISSSYPNWGGQNREEAGFATCGSVDVAQWVHAHCWVEGGPMPSP